MDPGRNIVLINDPLFSNFLRKTKSPFEERVSFKIELSPHVYQIPLGVSL